MCIPGVQFEGTQIKVPAYTGSRLQCFSKQGCSLGTQGICGEYRVLRIRILKKPAILRYQCIQASQKMSEAGTLWADLGGQGDWGKYIL